MIKKEEFINNLKSLKERENIIDDQISALSKEKHEIHVKERELYKEYVLNDERFPFKIGARYLYEDDVLVTVPLRVMAHIKNVVVLKDISCYCMSLNEIILDFEVEGTNDPPLIFHYVKIDGTLGANPNAKFTLIED